MKAETLLEIIGNADDAYILEAQRKSNRVSHNIKWAVACAAALILLIITGQIIELSQMRCYLVDTGNGAGIAGLSVSRAEEAVLWGKGMFYSETAPEEMTVTFDGKTYTGVYAYSYCAVGEKNTVDCYKSKDRYEDWDEFTVIAGTEKLDAINLAGMGFPETQKNQQPLDSTDVAELAKWWASKYVAAERFAMRQTHVIRDSENGILLYTYEFVRLAGGRDTTDRLIVQLTDRGILCQIGGMQSRWVKGEGMDLARLRLVNVEKKLQEVLGEKSFQIQKCQYGITPEGNPVILVSCSVTVPFGSTMITFMIQ